MRTRLPLRFALPALVVGGLGFAPGVAEAQVECELMRSNFTTSLEVGGGNRITYVSGPLLLGCDDGTRIRADSAQSHSATSFHQLFGNVFFENPEKEMTADRAHYFERESRLVAWGSVVLTDKVNNSVLRGDSLRYLRAGANRPEDELTVSGGRAHGTLFPEVPAPSGNDQPGADAESAVGGEPAPVPPVAPNVVPGSTAPGLSPSAVSRSPEDEAGAEVAGDTIREPYEVDADRIVLEGDRLFRATGSVEIRREGMEAFADTAEYDQVAELFLLMGNARMLGDGYDLSGRRIVLRAPDDELRDVVASGDALLTSDDIVLTSPEIRIFLTDGQMERLVAVMIPGEAAAEVAAAPDDVRANRPPTDVVAAGREGVLDVAPRRAASGRPEALTEDFFLVGDSIEVRAPGERLEQVVAVGRARGESLAGDTLQQEDVPEMARRDWIEGDTIFALFLPGEDEAGEAPLRPEVAGVPDPEADTAAEKPPARYVIERLVARGDARSLYRMEPSDTTGAEGPPRLALHYVKGREITILMRDGEVDRMDVEGPTEGIHLEPVRREARVAPPADEGAVRDRPGGPQ